MRLTLIDSIRYGIKTNDGRKLLVQSTVVGHMPKGVWVTQVIAGGELCVLLKFLK